MLFLNLNINAQSYDQLWKEVEEAQKDNLPKTQLKFLDQIYDKASKEAEMGQMLKALATKSECLYEISPDSVYTYLKQLEQLESSITLPTDKAILNSMIAGLYGQYYNQNSWQLNNNNNIVDEKPSNDIRQWSANQFIDVILKRGWASLQPKEELFKTSTRKYVPFTIEGKASQYYHHNLYQLLATRFIVQLENFDSKENKKYIEKIYQQLLEMYNTEEYTNAYILTKIDYLKWEKNNTNKDLQPNSISNELPVNSYITSLDSLINHYSNYEACIQAYYEKAEYALKYNQPAIALKLCNEAIIRHPHYKYINTIYNLRERILQPSLQVVMPEVGYPNMTVDIPVSFKNINQFTIDILKENKVILKNRFELTPSNDYRVSDTIVSLKMPDLGEYSYVVTPTNQSKKKQLKSNKLYISRLNLISIPLPNKKVEIITLDDRSGHPIPDTKISLYNYKNVYQNSYVTNKEGAIIIPAAPNSYKIKISKENDRFLPMTSFYGRYNFNSSTETIKNVKLITDRAIYRPGQTIHVKGIAYTQNEDTASVVVNEKYTLKLLDANRQEITQKEVISNDFGSFCAEFILPAACLNGTFTLTTENGAVNIQVQDYKLPTFEITFDKNNISYQLRESINVKGKAVMLNGVPMQDVKLNYTITRQPLRWWWRSNNEKDIIATGNTELLENGNFTIPVELLVPDNDDNPYYSYRVKASITNLSGETQVNYYTINAGKHSMMLHLKSEEYICKENMPVVIIQAFNLDGQPIQTNGIYHIYRLEKEMSTEKAIEQTAVYSSTFIANQPLSTQEWDRLTSGNYVIRYCAKDSQEQEVCHNSIVTLFSLIDQHPPVYTNEWFYVENDSFDELHPGIFYYGTSQEDAYIMMKVFSGNKVIDNRTFNLSNAIKRFEFPYNDDYGDGLTIRICYLKNKKLYTTDFNIKKRLKNKMLDMKWEVFRDKLSPGQKEEWKLTIKTPLNTPANAEMLALMYDAALDQLYPYNQKLNLLYNQGLPYTTWSTAKFSTKYYSFTEKLKLIKAEIMSFDTFTRIYLLSPNYILRSLSGAVYGMSIGKQITLRKNEADMGIYGSAIPIKKSKESFVQEYSADSDFSSTPETTILESTNLRTNFNETAFFYPQLRTNEQGEISFSFTMPESLTRWAFHGFAHTKGMLTGNMEALATTSKDFMLMPNMPRFVRVNDVVTITATISNLTPNEISGTAIMTLFNPTNEKAIDTIKTPFAVKANQTTTVSFSFKVSDEQEILGCRMIADGGKFSDGEQRLIPVLSDKIHLTESVAMPIRGNETRTFSLEGLFNHHSQTATNRSLTVEFTGNPTWYAVQALPSVATTQDASATSYATAYYANSLASWIISQQPRIKTIFETWKKQGGSKETLWSNLEKNQELKNIILSESPWIMEAKTEQEQKERIATLFDLNNTANNNQSMIRHLKELQLPDGSWSWYKGMMGSVYTTQYIVELNARLSALTGNALDGQMATMQNAAIKFLQKEITDEYNSLSASERKDTWITNLALRYLYITAISKNETPALDNNVYNFFLSKVNNFLTNGTMEQKAMAAIVLNKANRKSEALKFMASLKEHLTQTNEMGMFFDFNTNPYSWGGLQLPAHVMVMEAFNTVTNNQEVANEMKIWLLKQKQTQAWNSPVATANAIYALLMRGDDLLNNQGDVTIRIGNQTIKTNASTATPGLGYVKDSYTSTKMLDAKQATVTKHDNGIAWGAVYAQYNEDVSEVKQYGKEMTIEKKLYVQRMVNNEKQISPITSETQLSVGDVVVCRLILNIDRDIDFVQLKDQRAACFEPVSSISGYKWSNGFSYYMDIKDASTSFFFDRLSKGVYVIEYNYYVDRKGQYQSGIATIQSAYAPEFSSHSNSYHIEITK